MACDEDGRWSKQISEWRPKRKRKKDQPRRNWYEGVKEGMMNMGMREVGNTIEKDDSNLCFVTTYNLWRVKGDK